MPQAFERVLKYPSEPQNKYFEIISIVLEFDYMFFFISITFISIPSLSFVKKISIY